MSRVGANEKVVLGFIGTGSRGQHLMRVAMANPDVEIAAVCDVMEQRLAQAVKMTGDRATAYRDFRRLLERKDLDAVFIITPDHWHCIMTILACEAGKDVYVEKPLGHNIAEGRAAVNAAKRFGRIVQHGTQQLSGRHYAEARELIRSGALGRITHVRCWNLWNETPNGIGNPPDSEPPPDIDYDLWLGPAPKRPFNLNRCYAPGYWYQWDYSGGHMLAWAIHHIDVVHWVLGRTAPKMVVSVGGKYALRDNRTTPDTQDALLDYGDLLVHISVHHANARPIEGSWYGIAFYGTNGTLRLLREGFEVYPEGDRTRPLQREGSPLDEPHVRNFVDCVKSRTQPVAPIEWGHWSTNAVHLANIALRTGRAVRWNAQQEKIVGDEEANRYLCRVYRKPWGQPVWRYLSPAHRKYYRETA
ncbi:MAG: Gfo/Idh/MocA family oxidoreductase [Armatimonadota bacterium]|nr:Gfo/Idh/MocA family oxidoreductase [bacterium]MCS7310621.1 Gfo/Idh/MocA family oxidoreductase [Armatimonadota bacterium]MDW8105286.1 Gfo/Idh/MocA family oxidoreductase [Armatimonadota bacterium]MDW8290824.1 Gfo/Idh/MocA family oxidoreductase [Armatimonadota bacterium]